MYILNWAHAQLDVELNYTILVLSSIQLHADSKTHIHLCEETFTSHDHSDQIRLMYKYVLTIRSINFIIGSMSHYISVCFLLPLMWFVNSKIKIRLCICSFDIIYYFKNKNKFVHSLRLVLLAHIRQYILS
jgi:hypothetical protein